MKQGRSSAGVRLTELAPPPKYKCEAAPIVQGLGAEPPAWSRGRAPGQASGGQSPHEAETFWLLEWMYLLKVKNLPTFKKNLKHEKSDTISVVFSKNDVYRLQYAILSSIARQMAAQNVGTGLMNFLIYFCFSSQLSHTKTLVSHYCLF